MTIKLRWPASRRFSGRRRISCSTSSGHWPKGEWIHVIGQGSGLAPCLGRCRSVGPGDIEVVFSRRLHGASQQRTAWFGVQDSGLGIPLSFLSFSLIAPPFAPQKSVLVSSSAHDGPSQMYIHTTKSLVLCKKLPIGTFEVRIAMELVAQA
jgi:hypothetical protein